MIKKLLLLSCAASSLFATNGVNMIGTGTVSRSMGGTGVAFFSSGSDAMNKNVALIADVKESELHFDLTYFNATVTSTVYDQMVLNTTPSYYGPVTAESQNHIDTNFIPTLSYVSRIDDSWSWGASMFGVAGLGVDYKGELAQRQMKSGMMLMKVIPAVSYRTGNTTFGFAPVLGLGSMSINYDEDQSDTDENGVPRQSDREGLFGTNIGGPDLVPAFGWQAGMDVKVSERLRIGTTYHSSLKYKYKDVSIFKQFGPHGMVLMANDYLKKQGAAGFS
jgi:long-subunit fatty acid transport protein